MALEVKTASNYESRLADGLRAFARRHPECHRSVLLYGGSAVILDGDVVALPIAALWQSPLADEPASGTAPRISTPAGVGDPDRVDLFVSYARRDDELDGGSITALAEDLGARYELKTARPLRVVSDRDLAWGDVWAERLDAQVQSARFLLAVVTPAFLASTACRKEALDFRANEGPGRVLLPLL